MRKHLTDPIKDYINSKLADAVSSLLPVHTSPWDSTASFFGVAGIAILMFFAISWIAKPGGDRLSFIRFVIQAIASVGTGIAIIWTLFPLIPYDSLERISWIVFGIGSIEVIVWGVRRALKRPAFTGLVPYQHGHPGSPAHGIPVTCPQCGLQMHLHIANRCTGHPPGIAPPPAEPAMEMVECPNCKSHVPKTNFCIECAQPLSGGRAGAGSGEDDYHLN